LIDSSKDIACNHAVSIFNDGFINILEVMLNLTINPNCFNFYVELDECCVRFSERSFIEKIKKTQRFFRLSKKGEDEKNFNLEGQLYEAEIAE